MDNEKVTRVRYKRDGVLLRSADMMGREFAVNVVIAMESNSWTLYKSNEVKTVLSSGNGKTLPLVKKAVKAALKSVGVNFLDEMRITKKELKELYKKGEEDGEIES